MEDEYLLVFVFLLDLIVAEYGSDEVGPFLGVVLFLLRVSATPSGLYGLGSSDGDKSKPLVALQLLQSAD